MVEEAVASHLDREVAHGERAGATGGRWMGPGLQLRHWLCVGDRQTDAICDPPSHVAPSKARRLHRARVTPSAMSASLHASTRPLENCKRKSPGNAIYTSTNESPRLIQLNFVYMVECTATEVWVGKSRAKWVGPTPSRQSQAR